MAPRRGGDYSDSYGENDPWSETVWLSLEYHRGKNLFYGQFAFDILSLLALIAFFIWTCRIKNRSLPLKGIMGAVTCFICSEIIIITWAALSIAETEVTMYYIISMILQDFFMVMGICLTFYIFWTLINRFLGLLTSSGKPHASVTSAHSLLFALIVVMALAQTALYIVYSVGIVTGQYSFIQLHFIRLNGALHIIYWLLSMEVVGCTIYLVMKAGSHRFVSKVNPGILSINSMQTDWLFQAPAIALISAAVCWFVVCFTSAVTIMAYSLTFTNRWPVYLDLLSAIIQFVFLVGTYTGILMCCAKWHNLGDEHDYSAPHPPAQYPPQHMAEGHYPSVQQPYGAPYQGYSTQPQTHHQVSPQ
ncbi:PDZ-binding protein CRIPT [Penicillium cf. griseofulvum]|uniref:PDZ-binding protein CRIPT n=1 Tax=Penicillium cf. griseofulvum TaxID=2972120 RepID=A0A9W9JSB4_9EURO|nr:PDZ-binding protein CRIPT [Penicillium cf. griseofulvum]KAJ5423371.1 PDZ-binding protein CRIPT [Penicillium cf. griseofulvum]KAJ5431360.1 PDZ-binding protein CRIPT [Penicillium cf. griseofulvum]